MTGPAQIAFPWAGESGPKRKVRTCEWFDFLAAYARVHARWERAMRAERRANEQEGGPLGCGMISISPQTGQKWRKPATFR